MANIHLQLAVSFLDENNRRASFRLPFRAPDTKTLADILNKMVDLGWVWNPFMQGEIIPLTVSINFGQNYAWQPGPFAGSDVEKAGIFRFKVATLPIYSSYGIAMPAVTRSYFPNGKLDLDNSDVVALSNFMTSTSDGFVFTDNHDLDIKALAGGYLSLRHIGRSSRNHTNQI